MSALCLVQLATAGQWAALSLLLLLTALSTLPVVVRRPDERPVALPTVVGCLAASVLLALPDGILTPGWRPRCSPSSTRSRWRSGSAFDVGSRTATARAAALAAVAAVLLRGRGRQPARCWPPTSPSRARARSAGRGGPGQGRAWRVGAAQLVVAVWVFAAAGDLRHVEWYSLSRGRRAADRRRSPAPAAARRGRRGGRRCSWPPSRQQRWRSSRRTPPAPWACWWPPRPRCCSARWPSCGLRCWSGRSPRCGSRSGSASGRCPGRSAPRWSSAALLLALGLRGERRPVAGFGARLADLRAARRGSRGRAAARGRRR